MAKVKSRPARWEEACSEARERLDAAKEAAEAAVAAFEALKELQDEYGDWLDNMPDGLRAGPTGEKIEALMEIDLEPGENDIEAMEQALDEAEAAELPMGFGRD
jgi:hypothetical protein